MLDVSQSTITAPGSSIQLLFQSMRSVNTTPVKLRTCVRMYRKHHTTSFRLKIPHADQIIGGRRDSSNMDKSYNGLKFPRNDTLIKLELNLQVTAEEFHD